MSSPAPVDVGDALDDLINQFADPMSFFRELIQNALDAGSGEVDIDFEFETSGDAERGAMIVIVSDYGEGMDREIIDNKLTRLFSSAKDGDMTKIGKFGIGFVSVFAIEPDAVCVDTARAGEAWRVLFDAERNFKRLRLDRPMEGTTIRIIKNSSRADYERFVARAKQVVSFWCRHAHGEVRICGELVSEPFGLEAPIVHIYEDDFSHVHIGHRLGRPTVHTFFNGGLTLVEADQHHDSSVEALHGLCFKVSSRYLEHTLTRDDVIRDGHFEKVVKKLLELARGPLRERVFEELDAAVKAGWPTAPGPESTRLQLLYEAALWHFGGGRGVSRREAKLACARSPSGEIRTWAELREAIEDHDGGLYFTPERSPLSDALEREGLAVVASYAGVRSSRSEYPESVVSVEGTVLRPLAQALRALTGTPPATWLGRSWWMPLAPERGEVLQWQALKNMLARLLDDTGHKIAGVRFGRFERSGSVLDGRVAISQREFGVPTKVEEAGEIGRGLFSRRRVLVIDADHPVVRTLLGLSLREPELAAYQLAKLFLLVGGSIPPDDDSALADAAMRYRETRCPKPLR